MPAETIIFITHGYGYVAPYPCVSVFFTSSGSRDTDCDGRNISLMRGLVCYSDDDSMRNDCNQSLVHFDFCRNQAHFG